MCPKSKNRIFVHSSKAKVGSKFLFGPVYLKKMIMKMHQSIFRISYTSRFPLKTCPLCTFSHSSVSPRIMRPTETRAGSARMSSHGLKVARMAPESKPDYWNHPLILPFHNSLLYRQ